MKVWVVLEDWAWNLEIGLEVIGVFDSYEKAKVAFDKAVEKNRRMDEENDFDQFDLEKDCYNAWLDGEYATSHTTVTIGEYELNKMKESLDG